MIHLKMNVGQLQNNRKKLINKSLFLLFGCLLVLSFGEAIAHKTTQQESNRLTAHHKILISNFTFEPENLTVRKGDTITWINKDFAPHSIVVNEKNGITTKLSSNMSTDKKFTMTIDDGFDYLCGLHPSMTGKILIQK